MILHKILHTQYNIMFNYLSLGMNEDDISNRSKGFLRFPQCTEFRVMNRELSQILESSQELKMDACDVITNNHSIIQSSGKTHLKSRFKSNQNKMEETKKELLFSLNRDNIDNTNICDKTENKITDIKSFKPLPNKKNSFIDLDSVDINCRKIEIKDSPVLERKKSENTVLVGIDDIFTYQNNGSGKKINKNDSKNGSFSNMKNKRNS